LNLKTSNTTHFLLTFVLVLSLFSLQYGQEKKEKKGPDLVTPLLQASLSEGVPGLKKELEALKVKYKESDQFSAALLVKVGEQLSYQKKAALALKIFQLNFSFYPDSAVACNGVGIGYEWSKKWQKALAHYKKAVEMSRNAGAEAKEIHSYKNNVKGLKNRLKRMALKTNFPVMKGAYLGRPLPGRTLTHFAPEIFFTSTTPAFHMGLHGSLCFSPEGDELYFEEQTYTYETNTYSTKIMVMRMKNGGWTAPEPVSFSKGLKDGSPGFSMDGKRLYFTSNRPVPGSPKGGIANIFYVERIIDGKKKGWSQPVNIGTAINSQAKEAFPTVTNDGTIYFIRNDKKEKMKSEIFYSRFVDGKYRQAQRLGPGINTPDYEVFPQITSDGKRLFFSRLGGPDSNGIYSSTRDKNGKWELARRIADQLAADTFRFGFSFSPDGKYIFIYARYINESKPDPIAKEAGIYWVEFAALK
jgi:Tol biopolymer transport system component